MLPDIITLQDQSITFKTFDKDLASSDFLGDVDPVDIIDLLADDSIKHFELEIFEENG